MDVDKKFIKDVLSFHLSDSNIEVTKISNEFIKEMEDYGKMYSKILVSYKKDQKTDIKRMLVQQQVGTNKEFYTKLYFMHFILLKEMHTNAKLKPTFDYLTKCLFIKTDLCALEDPFEQGFCNVPTWNTNHAKTVINCLAQWHALCLTSEIETSKVNNYKPNDKYEFYLNDHFRNENYIIKNTANALDIILLHPEFKHKFSSVKNNLQNYLDFAIPELNGTSKNKFKNVFCLGEITVKNTLFKVTNKGEMSCKFVDLQMSKYLPPIFDVLYLLYNNLPEELLVDNKQFLVEYYMENLELEMNRHGFKLASIITKAEFAKTMEIYKKLVKFTKNMKDIYEIIRNSDGSVKLNYEALQSNLNLANKGNLFTENLMKLKYLFECQLLEYEELCKITQLCTRVNNFEIANVEFNKLAFGNGFLADHYFMKLDAITENLTKTVNCFVKLYPTNEDCKLLVENNNAFFKECRFFNKLLPELKSLNINLWDDLPKCFISKHNMLVFEDLSVYGYKGINSRTPLSLECLKMLLSKMAKLHASGFVYEEKLRLATGQYTKINELYPSELHEALFIHKGCMLDYVAAACKGICTMLKLFSSDLLEVKAEDLCKWLENYGNDIFNWVKPSGTYRNTICHGDLWHNNIMFKIGTNGVVDCKMVDFQSYRYYPPGREFMSVLYWCTNREFRHTHDVSKYYYDHLKKYCMDYDVDVTKLLTYDEFLESAVKSEPYCAIQASWWAQMGKQTVEQLKEYQHMLNAFMYEDRSDLIVELCNVDPVYKNLMRNFVLDFKELYVNSLNKVDC